MAQVQFSGDTNVTNVSKPVKRMRWATQRRSGHSAVSKRKSILSRVPKVRVSNHDEKGGNSDGNGEDNGPGSQKSKSRSIYTNVPLPAHTQDEDGDQSQTFVRNKIRTAKYTPLSFVPKNLWFQFHNVANIYFLFIIILSVRPLCLNGYDITDKMLDLLHLRCLKRRPQLRSSDLHSRGDRY